MLVNALKLQSKFLRNFLFSICFINLERYNEKFDSVMFELEYLKFFEFINQNFYESVLESDEFDLNAS